MLTDVTGNPPNTYLVTSFNGIILYLTYSEEYL
jgi:hypothetical protein